MGTSFPAKKSAHADKVRSRTCWLRFTSHLLQTMAGPTCYGYEKEVRGLALRAMSYTTSALTHVADTVALFFGGTEGASVRGGLCKSVPARSAGYTKRTSKNAGCRPDG